MIKLGDIAKDNVSGFTGIVVGRVEYLSGYIQLQLQPKGLKDGVPIGPQWIDEGQLEGVQRAVVKTGRVTPPL